MTRLHPFDFVFGTLAEERFPEIRAEAQQAARDPSDRLHFQQLAAVRRLLGEVPAEAGAAMEAYGALFYAVYRYWDTGRHWYAVTLAGLDRADQLGIPGNPTVPHGACYLQLPERTFWARIADTAAPEPLDGVFLVAGAAGAEITVLAVLGLRPDREGFSQLAVTAPAADFPRAREAARRPLFAPVLEGGDRAGIKSLVSEAELLHLAHLALAEVPR